jgi:hypothetical protein
MVQISAPVHQHQINRALPAPVMLLVRMAAHLMGYALKTRGMVMEMVSVMCVMDFP